MSRSQIPTAAGVRGASAAADPSTQNRTDGGRGPSAERPRDPSFGRSSFARADVDPNIEPPQLNEMDPILDEANLASSMNQQFNAYKSDQRALMEKRNQIQKRIEGMRREYDFIQNLDARDVNYVKEKKLEHAAILVQRNWRRMKAEREYKKARMGMRKELDQYERTDEDIERMKQNEFMFEQYSRVKIQTKPWLAEDFHAEISDERKRALKEQVMEEAKKKSDHEIQNLPVRQINAKYKPVFDRFNNSYGDQDVTRIHAVSQLKTTLVMADFLFEYDHTDKVQIEESRQRLRVDKNEMDENQLAY